LSKLDKPLLLFQRPLTSWAFMNFSEFIRQGKRADMINSSDYSDLVPHLYMLRAMHHVANSKILVVRPGSGNAAAYQPWTDRFGTRVELPAYQEFKDAYEQVNIRMAGEAAEEFKKNALRIIEPKAGDILDSTRFYLATLEVLRRRKANALTIDCLGGFRRGDLPAYPCVAFSKLNDAGLYGVCEADFPSTMTQLLVTAYSGKPGFVSDPTFDTSRNEVIHAHCVSATKLRGLGAEASPYTLRTHMEDEKGVSLQVEMPIRETITCGKFADPKTFLVSTGEVTANLDDRRGCRTKIITKVADARKMAEGFTGGLHRVLFYGDHSQAIERMGRLMGFKTVREC
jgi:L-fucose isomerase-like protein